MFVCLVGLSGNPATDADLRRYERRMASLARPRFEQAVVGAFGFVSATSQIGLRRLIARSRGLIGVGNVRLDNRPDLERQVGITGLTSSDLEFILDCFAHQGPSVIDSLVGDFAFCLWNAGRQELVAARDALGVRQLFVSTGPKHVAVASHLSLLHETDALDEEFVADFLVAGGRPGSTRTIWKNVEAVTPGSTVTVSRGASTRRQFWSPEWFVPRLTGDPEADVSGFAGHFVDAVKSRLSPRGGVWAELSGGTDSSSVVSLAATLERAGDTECALSGTLTIVDSLGEGDERHYSDLVVHRYGIRNDLVENRWPWQDDGLPAPLTDEPRAFYPFFARDRELCGVARRAGGRVILSGIGSDHYLAGSKLFLADLLANGRVIDALSETASWAVAERQSFWKAAYRHLLTPLMPHWLMLRQAEPWQQVPSWIDKAFVRRCEIGRRLPLPPSTRLQGRDRFSTQVINSMLELPNWLPRGAYEDGIETRYPFLHRPLVEHGMTLPVSLRARPLSPKWILREAMKGILPEPIRTRQGKGGIDARILWAMSQERDRLSQILRDPILAQAGYIEPGALREAVSRAQRGDAPNLVMLLSALALETWLFVRAGRWTVREATTTTRTSGAALRAFEPIVERRC